MAVDTNTSTGTPIRREITRNIRGQIVSYTIPASTDSTIDTPEYGKVYMDAGENGLTVVERFSRNDIVNNFETNFSELSFQFPNVGSNVNVISTFNVGVEVFVATISSADAAGGNPSGGNNTGGGSTGSPSGGGGGGATGGGSGGWYSGDSYDSFYGNC